MPDYDALAVTAERLIKDAGREITLVEMATAADANRPWRASDLTPTSTLTVYGVFSDPASLKMQDLLPRAEQVVMIGTTLDLSIYNKIIESDLSEWSIMWAKITKPADITLIYSIGVSR